MNRLLLLACVAVLLTSGVAAAAPGDFVTITGTAQYEKNALLVVRSDDGATYFADLRGATRGRPFRIGDTVSIAGYEGQRPDEINVAIVEPAAGPGTVASGDVVVIDGWRLPRSHVYQAQDDGGVYHDVRVQDVPATIARGKEVYDRTASAWVNHPTAYASTGGRNPAYTVAVSPIAPPTRGPAGWEQVRGIVQRIDEPGVTLRTDDGRTVIVDITEARPTLRDSLERGDRVVAIGHTSGPNRFAARYIREERRVAVSPIEGTSGWQRVHGTVLYTQGSIIQFRTDDGRVLIVDVSDVTRSVQRALEVGEGATIIGFAGPGRDQFRAEYVVQSAADSRRGR
jgi:hypothetical protein